MKKVFVFGLFIALISCGKTTFNSQLGAPFKMRSNESVKIEETDLKLIGFKIVEDSRCPTGANCFWEGQVVAEFNMDGSSFKLNSFKTLDTLGYTFAIRSVEPMRKDGVDIPLSNYILELLITK